MLFRLLALIPLPVLHALAIPLTVLIGSVFRYRRSRVTRNLRNAFPDRTAAELATVRGDFYRNLTDVAVESVKASRMTREELCSRVEIVNPELIIAFAERQQPVMVIGSHQTNWEWIFLACSAALPVPLEGIYRPLHSKGFDRYMQHTRTQFGARLIADNLALKDIMANVRNTRVVSLIGDQHPPKKEPRYWTRFLEQDTAFYTGWAKLAQFARYPVLYADRERIGRGRYRVTFKLIGEPPYPRTADPLVERFARELEQSIRHQPYSWLWSHRRWREEKPVYDD